MSDKNYPAGMPDHMRASWDRANAYLRSEERAKRITADEVMAFLAAKGAKSECSQCGANSWGLSVPKIDGLADIQVNAADGRSFTRIPYLTLTCSNCAFLRQHAAIVISDWLIEERDAYTPPVG